MCHMTANQIVKSHVATGGVIAGVMVGLYIATKFDYFPTTPDRLALADGHTQYLGRWNYHDGVRSEEIILDFGMVISD